MPEKKTQQPNPIIGVDMFTYAKLNETSDVPGGTPTYDDPNQLPGLVSIAVARNSQTATFYADNGAYVTASQTGDTTLTVGNADVPPPILSEWLGVEYEDGMLEIGQINPVTMFIAYRIKKANGAYRYVRFYKAKPGISDENANTQGNSINFQSGTTVFGIAKLISRGKSDGRIDTDDPNLRAGVTQEVIERNFFKDPLWKPADGDKFPPPEEGGGTGGEDEGIIEA